MKMKVGIDIVEIKRIITSDSFLNRILTQNEIEYIAKFKNKKEHIAGIFCAKEAIFKALDLKIFKPKDIEIFHNSNGKPCVLLKHEYLNFFKNNYNEIEVSITHCNTIAQAICIIS